MHVNCDIRLSLSHKFSQVLWLFSNLYMCQYILTVYINTVTALYLLTIQELIKREVPLYLSCYCGNQRPLQCILHCLLWKPPWRASYVYVNNAVLQSVKRSRHFNISMNIFCILFHWTRISSHSICLVPCKRCKKVHHSENSETTTKSYPNHVDSREQKYNILELLLGNIVN